MTAAARAPRIGPGTLVVVVGPSGAGKDTLIGLARALCANDARVVFPRRIVTRSPSACVGEMTRADLPSLIAVA